MEIRVKLYPSDAQWSENQCSTISFNSESGLDLIQAKLESDPN